MRKASTRLPEQGTQTPSPAPDLIPAETKNQPRTDIRIGTANGGTSEARRAVLDRIEDGFSKPSDRQQLALHDALHMLSTLRRIAERDMGEHS